MSNYFSQNLRLLRGDRKKADFARLLGLSAPVYQRYEDGRTPRSDVLSVIAKRLNVSVESLLAPCDSKKNTNDAPYPFGKQVEYGAVGELCAGDHFSVELRQLKNQLRQAHEIIRYQAAALAALSGSGVQIHAKKQKGKGLPHEHGSDLS